MGSKRIKTIIVADSRGKIFLQKKPPNEHLYQTYNIVIRGARISHLLQDTICRLKSISKEDIKIVKLCAGINEITKKIRHKSGSEIVVDLEQCLWQHILEYKSAIRVNYPNALVGICTIPPVDLNASLEHYKQKGWLKESVIGEEDRIYQQQQITETLTHINHLIVTENKKPQHIPQVGDITPSQFFFHQEVERTYTRKRKDGSRRTTKHIRTNSLSDGVHPTDEVAQKLFEVMHETIKKEIDKIRFTDEYPPIL
jgi:hypothetical protein